MRIPRRIHLTSGVLPAGSILTTQDFFDIPAGAQSLTFYVTYTEGLANGRPQMQFQWSNGSEISNQPLIEGGSLVNNDPFGFIDIQLQRTVGPDGGGSTLNYVIRTKIPGGATSVRLQIAEFANAANPGTAQIALTGSSEDGGEFGENVDNSAVIPSGTIPAPAPFLIPRTEHLASQTLPAAGAFTSQALAAIPAGTKRISFWISYTRGAAGGFAIFHPEFDNGTDTGRDILKDPIVVITEPNGRFETPLSEPAGPQPQDGNALEWVETYDVPANTTRIRLLVAEAGVVGTPGDIAVAFTGDG